jgi:hypothetical protein
MLEHALRLRTRLVGRKLAKAEHGGEAGRCVEKIFEKKSKK